MQTIEIKEGVQVSIDRLLQGIQKLDAKTLETLAQGVNSIVLRKRTQPPTAKRESELLRQIKSIIPASVKREEKRLYSKMQQGTITEKEHEELLFLLDFMENKAAERIYLMAELAKLRGISIQELVKQLNQKS